MCPRYSADRMVKDSAQKLDLKASSSLKNMISGQISEKNRKADRVVCPHLLTNCSEDNTN